MFYPSRSEYGNFNDVWWQTLVKNISPTLDFIGAFQMKDLLVRLYKDESAATAVEYAIIAALVGVASIFAVSQFGDAITQLFQDAADSVNNR